MCGGTQGRLDDLRRGARRKRPGVGLGLRLRVLRLRVLGLMSLRLRISLLLRVATSRRHGRRPKLGPDVVELVHYPLAARVVRLSPEERLTHPAVSSVPENAGPMVPRTEPAAGAASPGGVSMGSRTAVEPPARDLLERVRQREPRALEAFFERYFDPIYSLAHRLIGARPGAEDVTQDVFLKVHRAIDQLDPARDPWPWLATIVHNACRDLWRSGAYRLTRRSDPIDGESALPTPNWAP